MRERIGRVVHGFGGALGHVAAWSMALLPMAMPIAASAGEIRIDPSAPRSLQPGLSRSSTGTPVIDIVTPQSGISHNRFDTFSAPSGVVFNNSATGGVSQTAGRVQGNPRLVRSGPANVILNEVRGVRASRLGGAIEVFGGRADVIIANENGVHCSGCRFINTGRATLTSGRPSVSGGNISFQVGKGLVGVWGGGISGADDVGLIGRHVVIGGKVSANRSITASGGAQYYDYGKQTARPAPVLSPRRGPYAVDATALGAMTAGQIRIVGNESGLGVRTGGTLTTRGNLHLSSRGDILFRSFKAGRNASASATGAVRQIGGQARAAGDIFISGRLFSTARDSSLAAGGIIRIKARDFVSIAGEARGRAIEVVAEKGVYNLGRLVSGEALEIVAGEVHNRRPVVARYGAYNGRWILRYEPWMRWYVTRNPTDWFSRYYRNLLDRVDRTDLLDEKVLSGGDLIGHDIAVTARTGSFTNTGVVRAVRDLTITAREDIQNLAIYERHKKRASQCAWGDCGYSARIFTASMTAGGQARLIAGRDIVNQGGTIDGGARLTAIAVRNITNDIAAWRDVTRIRTQQSRIAARYGRWWWWRVQYLDQWRRISDTEKVRYDKRPGFIGSRAGIASLQAGTDIVNRGGVIEGYRGLTLRAGRDIRSEIVAFQNATRTRTDWSQLAQTSISGSWWWFSFNATTATRWRTVTRTDTIRYSAEPGFVGSTRGSATLIAGRDILLKASSARAAGTLTLDAGRQLSLVNATYRDSTATRTDSSRTDSWIWSWRWWWWSGRWGWSRTQRSTASSTAAQDRSYRASYSGRDVHLYSRGGTLSFAGGVSASGNLTLYSQADIAGRDAFHAGGDLLVYSAGGALRSSGALSAGRDLTLFAARDVTLTGALSAGRNASITAAGGGLTLARALSVPGAMRLVAGSDLAAHAALSAGGALRLESRTGSIRSAGHLTAGTSLDLVAERDITSTNGARITAGGDVRLTSRTGSIRLSGMLGGLQVRRAYQAWTYPLINGTGVYKRESWWTYTAPQLRQALVRGASVRLTAGQDIALDMAQIQSTGDVRLAAGRDITGTGRAYQYTTDQFTRTWSRERHMQRYWRGWGWGWFRWGRWITRTTYRNVARDSRSRTVATRQAGVDISGRRVALTAGRNIALGRIGTITASDDLAFDARGALSLSGGRVTGGSLDLGFADTLSLATTLGSTGQDLYLFARGRLTNGGTLLGRDILADADSIAGTGAWRATRDLDVYASGDVRLGTARGRDVRITSYGGAVGVTGAIAATRDVAVQAVTGLGLASVSGRDVTLATDRGTLVFAGGSRLTASRAFSLRTGGAAHFGAGARLWAGQSLTLAIAGALSLDARITGSSVTGASIASGGDLFVNAGSLVNRGSQLSAGGNLLAFVSGDLRNESVRVPQGRGFYFAPAAITAGKGLVLNAGGSIVNRGSRIAAGDFLRLDARGSIVNEASSGKYVSVNVNRSWRRCRGSWLWRRCTYYHERRYAEEGVIEAGRITAGGDLALKAGGDIRNIGSLVKAGGALSLDAGGSIVLDATKVELVRINSSSARSRGGLFGGLISFNLSSGSNGLDANRFAVSASRLEGGTVSALAVGDVFARGAEVAARSGIEIIVGRNLVVVPLALRTYANSYGRYKGWFSRSKWSRQAAQVRLTRSTARAGQDLGLRALMGDVVLKAAHLEAGGDLTLTADRGQVKLLVDKESDFVQQKRDSQNLVWWKKTDQGHYRETVLHTYLKAGGAIRFRAGNGLVVEYREGQGNLDATIRALAQAPELAWMAELQGRSNVSWRAVAAASEQWNYKQQGLTQAAAAVIALAVTIATQGVASGIAGAITGATAAGAQATVTQIALTKAITAGLTQIASRATVSLINNQGDLSKVLAELGSSGFVKSLAANVITAGLIARLDATVLSDAAWGIPSLEEQIAAGRILTKFDTFGQDLIRNAIRGTVRAGVNTAFQGGNLGKNLLAGLQNAAVDTLGAAVAEQIGITFKRGGQYKDSLSWGLHKVTHAALGCGLAAASGQDCASGAFGGVVGEIFADEFQNYLRSKALALSAGGADEYEILMELREWRRWGVDLAKLGTALGAMVAGLDVDTAARTAGNAAENNALGLITLAVIAVAAAYTTWQGDGNPLTGLEVIGTGNDPVSKALAAGTKKLLDFSEEHAPDATEAVLGALQKAGELTNAAFLFVDERTGRIVSRSWNSLDARTRNRLLGGMQVAGFVGIAAPAAAVSSRLTAHLANRGVTVGSSVSRLMANSAARLAWRRLNRVRSLDIQDVAWGRGIGRQGFPFEHTLRTILNLPEYAKLPDGFKTFDYFYEGRAISAKTIDLTGVSYGRPNGLYNTIKGYVDKAATFREYKLQDTLVTAGEITQRELHIGIPRGVATRNQIRQMQQAVSYGQRQGVRVTIYEIR